MDPVDLLYFFQILLYLFCVNNLLQSTPSLKQLLLIKLYMLFFYHNT